MLPCRHAHIISRLGSNVEQERPTFARENDDVVKKRANLFGVDTTTTSDAVATRPSLS